MIRQPDPAVSSVSVSPQNRRQFPRIHYKVEVTLESESTFYSGFTENISAGGLFIATYDLRPMGQQIQLEFTVPNRQQPISVLGEVRWIREFNPANPDMTPGMGVKFIGLSEQDRRDIEAFVAERETLFYDDEGI